VNFLEITPEDWEEAALISRELRSRGITIPMTDLLLAQLAKTHDLESYPWIPTSIKSPK